MFSTEIETPAAYRWTLAMLCLCDTVLAFQDGPTLHEHARVDCACRWKSTSTVPCLSDMHCDHLENFLNALFSVCWLLKYVAAPPALLHCSELSWDTLFCPTSHGPMQSAMCGTTMLCAEAHASGRRVGAPREEHKSSDSPGHKSLCWNYEQIYLHFNLNFH